MLITMESAVQEDEIVIWKAYPREQLVNYYAGYAAGAFFLFGGLLLIFFPPLGVILIIVGILFATRFRKHILRKKEYVVTNKRAMIMRHGKIVKEVPLNTPNLVVSTGFVDIGGQAHARRGLFSSSASSISYAYVDIIFVANGIELLRFEGVDEGRANELFVKLKSMGVISD